MISGFENVIIPSLICKAATQPIDIGFKCIGPEKFVGESGEREVEVVPQLTIPEFRRFGDRVPNPLYIGGEGGNKVLHWCGTEVITDNEKQKGFLMRSGYPC